MKRQIFAIAAVVFGSTLLAACSAPTLPGAQAGQTEQSASAANTANTSNAQRITVETGTIKDQVIGTGAITANASVDAAFQRSGTIKEVAMKVGDQVKAGQVLATLDDSDLRLSAQSQWASYLSAQAAYSSTVKGPTSAELKQAQAALSSAQATYNDLFKAPSDNSIADLRASLQNAEASLKQAQSAYDNAYRRDPAGIGGTSAALNLEQATNNYNAAKAKYDAAFEKPSNGSVASAAAQIQSARASLAALQPVSETIEQRKAAVDQAYIAWQQADNAIKSATLTAPMSGLVTAVNFVAGASVNSGAAVATIVDFAEPVFVVNVDEADLGKVQVGQDAQVRLQTYPETPIPAKVTSISPVGKVGSSITTYEIKLTIPKAADTPTILLNMSGTGEIITTQTADAVLVPNTVLIADSNARTFSVQRLGTNGQVETIQVEVGSRGTDKTQIISGVSAGDVLLVPSTTSAQQTPNFPAGPPAGGGE